ncbi:hypothetical protein [Deinococcus kurensis]|uniref:hypothetical protein n=1 Tax=Deinococcus kurensis TaxID=2662757 RepID=UPI0012D2DEB3|nr:hypothetical protein [Deinococcus kurensis]
MSDFQHVTRPKARKMHRCVECGERVQLGDTYVRVAGSYDGHMYTDRYCVTCDAVWRVAHAQGLIFSDEIGPGELLSHIEDDVLAMNGSCEWEVVPRYAHVFVHDANRPARQPLRALEVQA